MEEAGYALGELDRRLGNILRFGTVAAVDTANALVQVQLGDLVTDWVPWLTPSAGQDRVWHAPSEGEQVALLSPGDPSQGVVIGSLFQNAHPANGDDGNTWRVTFGDDTVISYDRGAHQLTVDTSPTSGPVVVNAGGGTVTVNCASATVNATDSVTLDTPTTHCTGDVQVDGNLSVGGDEQVTGNTTIGGNVQAAGSATVAGAIVGTGGMAISGGSGATMSGDMEITGGDVTADGISLKMHTHGGVTTGTDSTGMPS